MSLFSLQGIHCVVDGQFGSTGKGALAAWLAHQLYYNPVFLPRFGGAIYSGGPNSGHTCWFGDEQIVLKQLPTTAVYLSKLGVRMPIYLSAGAIIDRDVLKQEVEKYDVRVFVHPAAAIVTDEDRKAEMRGSIAEVAGTRSGTGAALARKILREPGAIAKNSLGNIASNVVLQDHRIKPEYNAYFMEVAQGFSLGINSHFYPKVTSRECTVMQGIADARIAPRYVSKTYMAIRTFPIRVGNVDGFSSGEWYQDQEELSWVDIQRAPELTTVTKRIRRIATFSMTQFYEACFANDPDYVFISHMDYLTHGEQLDLLEAILSARHNMNKGFEVIIGSGPKVKDISLHINGEDNE